MEGQENNNATNPEGGTGAGAGAETPQFDLSLVGQRVGREFSSPDDFYAHYEKLVAEKSDFEKKYESAAQVEKQWAQVPSEVRHLASLYKQGMTSAEYLASVAEAAQLATTDFTRLATENPSEVMIRASLASNPSLSRDEAMWQVREKEEDYKEMMSMRLHKSSYSELGEDERSEVDKQVRTKMVIEAKGHVHSLESGKPKFQPTAPDPEEQRMYAALNEGIKKTALTSAGSPYVVEHGGVKVEVRPSDHTVGGFNRIAHSDDPFSESMSFISGLMAGKDGMTDPAKVREAAVWLDPESRGAILSAFLERAKSSATLEGEARFANSNGNVTGNGTAPVTGTLAQKIAEVYGKTMP